MLAGETPSEACRLAGFSTTGPLKTIQSRMPDIMDRAGLTDIVLIENYLKPLLEARMVKSFKTTQEITDFELDESGKVIGKTETKKLIIEEREYADNTTRLGALNLAGRFKGLLNMKTGEEMDESREPQQVNVQIVHIGA